MADRLAPPLFGGQICGRWGAIRDHGDGETVTHWALDLCADEGHPLYALEDGPVVKVEVSEHGGNQIVMQWGPEIFTRYSHCQTIFRREGDYVRRGDVVGLSGRTGVNYRGIRVSPHLHFQMMDRIRGGHPIDMPAWLDNYGIVEKNRVLVWKDGYPKTGGSIATPILVGAGAVAIYLLLWKLTGSPWLGME